MKLLGQISLLVLCLAEVLFLGACLPSRLVCPPQRTFKMSQLLVDTSAFPAGWEVSPNGPSTPDLAPLGGAKYSEAIELFLYAPNSVAVESIYRFCNEEEAEEVYDDWLKQEFASSQSSIPWYLPVAEPYQGTVAKRSYLACGEHGHSFCRFLGQYEEYLFRLNVHLSPGFMTYTDFEQILRTIDQRMALYLGNE